MKIKKNKFQLYVFPSLLVSSIVLSACTDGTDNQLELSIDEDYLAEIIDSGESGPNDTNTSQNQLFTITAPADIQTLSQGLVTKVGLGEPTIYSVSVDYEYFNDAPSVGFRLGTTTVTWTAIDAQSNRITTTQLVTIVANQNSGSNDLGSPIDNNGDVRVSPLQIEIPPTIEIEATAELAIPNLQQPSISGGTPPYIVTNNLPESGYREGEYKMVWWVTDAKGQQDSASQNIRITSMCEANKTFFSKNVSPVLQSKCLSCHNPNGSQTPFNLVSSLEQNFKNSNLDIFTNISKKTDIEGLSLLLTKPINVNNDHGGGNVLQAESSEFKSIEGMVQRLQSCSPSLPTIEIEPLVLLDFEATLRKASIVLLGRIPTEQEITTLNQVDDLNAKQQIFLRLVDNHLDEQAFINTLKTIFNDQLLTNAYSTGTRGLGLRLNTFDNKKYFDNTMLTERGYSKADRNMIRANASKGIANAALELIAYIVQNNKPFTEILTADYVMVNPYSAKVFSAALPNNPDFQFVYGDAIADKDPDIFIPVRLIDNKQRSIPHAGILSTLPFLARFPSTPTNVNRKRAATVFKLFLNTNIEGLASRTALDLDNVIGEFPTFEDPQCKACHDVMDPVAGLFKNWNDSGQYRGDYLKWGNTKNPAEILSPGYSVATDDVLPVEMSDKALPWLAEKIAADSRFPLAMSKIMFEAITGQIGLNDSAMYESLKNTFVASNYNIKELIKAILLTDYFRVETILDNSNLININEFGNAKLLSPEQLNNKITSLTNGYEWKSPSNKSLTDLNTYNILYGGIDSVNVLTRTQQPTGIMAAVQQRLAYQVSCETVPLDFSKPITERAYFKFVEITDVPSNSIAIEKIKKNIQFLFQLILGQDYAVDSIEVTEAFNLFNAAITESVDNNIPGKCRADLSASDPIIVDEYITVRSWMAVLSYLYLDYKFLYQ